MCEPNNSAQCPLSSSLEETCKGAHEGEFHPLGYTYTLFRLLRFPPVSNQTSGSGFFILVFPRPYNKRDGAVAPSLFEICSMIFVEKDLLLPVPSLQWADGLRCRGCRLRP